MQLLILSVAGLQCSTIRIWCQRPDWLVPVLKLAELAGLETLAQKHLSGPTHEGANAGLKVSSLVAELSLGRTASTTWRCYGMVGCVGCSPRPTPRRRWDRSLRTFTFGHVRQLDAVASRFLIGLAEQAPALVGATALVLVDVDDTIIEVDGYTKQGSGYGYSGVRGLNVLLAAVTTASTALASWRLGCAKAPAGRREATPGWSRTS